MRLLIAARGCVVGMRTLFYNRTRGLVKTFGVVLAGGKGSSFANAVEAVLVGPLRAEPTIGTVLGAQLELWRTVGALATRYFLGAGASGTSRSRLSTVVHGARDRLAHGNHVSHED